MEVSKRALGLLATMAIVLTIGLVARDSAARKPRLQARSPERIAASALADSVARLGLRVRTSEARELVEAALAQSRLGPASRVMVLGGGLADTLARLTEDLVAGLNLPSDTHLPVRLVILEAPPQWPAPRAYVHTFTLLPDSARGTGCTAVRIVWADAIESPAERIGWQRLPWRGAVGPCWYLANFGLPGPAVRAWLDARYWDVAGAIPPRARNQGLESEAAAVPSWLYRALGEVGGGYRGGSAILESCASDKPVLCEFALLGSPYLAGLLPDGIVGTERLNVYSRQSYDWLTNVPPWISRELLSMMVEDLGPARFAAFWTSRASVPDAFEAAAGMPFAEWFRKQLRREMSQAGIIPPGERVSWPSAIGILALALGGSLWHARRRQVR